VSYAVKEVFFTLQGEGANAGRAAVFVRFSGCNLWTGLEKDRGAGRGGCSAWCDTDFVGMNGAGGGRFSSATELATHARVMWPVGGGVPLVVCTGGEPALQLDAALVDAFHHHGFEIAVETNGTEELPDGIDWVSVSPKAGAPLKLTRGSELKFVFPQVGLAPADFEHLQFQYFCLQPRDGADVQANTAAAVNFCLSHPRWRLSLQTHKALGLR
jgi:7-carboxy-7-deazaguanine synthase (Cx14CxxC type)